MSKQNRQAIAKLRAMLAADAYRPVDLRPVIAALQISIIGWHHGRPRKNESDLTRLARALRVSPETLFKLAYRDLKRFRARFLPLAPNATAELADDVACEVVREFLIEELTWQYIELAQAVGWHPPARMPLCFARPCRPADYRVPTAADLLALE